MTISPTAVEELAPPDTYASLLYGSFADRYERGADGWTTEAAMTTAVDVLLAGLQHVGPQRAGCDRAGAPSTVVDIGAGRGRDTARLAAAGHHVVAVDVVDLADSAVDGLADDWANLRARFGGAVRFLAGDFSSVAVAHGPAGGFAALLDNGCLHHQHPDRFDAWLDHGRRLLQPGGLWVVSVFEAPDEQGSGRRPEHGGLFVTRDGRINKEFGLAELTNLFARHRFSPLTVRRVSRDVAATDLDLTYLVVMFRKDG